MKAKTAGLTKWELEQMLLKELLDDQGLTLQEFLEEFGMSSLVPGICHGCLAVWDVEPDQNDGACDCCKDGSVKSGLVLAGIM